MEKYEELLKELSDIVSSLEEGNLALDEAIKKYERGMTLSKKCKELLIEAKQVVIKKMEENK